MRIVARSTLREFAKRYPDAEQALDAWYHEAKAATWASSAEVRQSSATVSIISAERVVFNIRAGHYRLVVQIDYDKGILLICFIGTHAEYDRIDARTVRWSRS